MRAFIFCIATELSCITCLMNSLFLATCRATTYAATKGALTAFTKALAIDEAEHDLADGARMPDAGLPAKTVKTLIENAHSLDFDQKLNTSSYVNVSFEPEEEEVALMGLQVTLADQTGHPKASAIHDSVVNMIASLWNCPKPDDFDEYGAGEPRAALHALRLRHELGELGRGRHRHAEALLEQSVTQPLADAMSAAKGAGMRSALHVRLCARPARMFPCGEGRAYVFTLRARAGAGGGAVSPRSDARWSSA